MQPPLGVGPPQLMEYVPVTLSTPIVDVKPVKVPEAVVLREELHAAAVVVVESSDFLQAPMTAIMPTIMRQPMGRIVSPEELVYPSICVWSANGPSTHF